MNDQQPSETAVGNGGRRSRLRNNRDHLPLRQERPTSFTGLPQSGHWFGHGSLCRSDGGVLGKQRRLVVFLVAEKRTRVPSPVRRPCRPRLAIFVWANRYNTRLLHSSLGYRSPINWENTQTRAAKAA
jgi:hypothetical protein